MSQEIGDHAVVLGASIAGLLTARVLTDAYARVTLVDRDELPETPAPSQRPPGPSHPCPRGTRPTGPGGAVSRSHRRTGRRWSTRRGHAGRRALLPRRPPTPQAHTGLLLLCASRPFLEGHVRARVRALPNVGFLDAGRRRGLATLPDGGRVTGARVVRRADGSAEELLAADLVVDASGRGSRTPAWLDALGYPRPERDEVQIGLGYSTRTYRLPPEALEGTLAILDAATPDLPRTGALQKLEGDRWMLTLAGILGDHPPTDPDGFLDFARSLRFPDIYQAIRDAEPLDDPVGFRFPASVRHRYERLGRFPAGFLAIGDAVCSFNPIYGQGMTVAALEALTLRRHLERGVEPQPRHWFRDLARVIDMPWEMSAGGDLAFPGVPGRRTLKIRLLNGYLARLHAAAAEDADLATAFIRVVGLVAQPQSLLTPGAALRVLRKGHPHRRPES